MVQSGFALKGYLLQGKELHCSGGLWICLLDMHLDNELTTIHQFKYFQDFLNHAGSSENEKLSLDCRRDSTYSRGHFYFGAFWAYLFENSSHYVPSCIFNLCDLKSKLFMVWRFLSLTGCSFVWSKLFRGLRFLSLTGCPYRDMLSHIVIHPCYPGSGALLLELRSHINQLPIRRRSEGYMNLIKESANLLLWQLHLKKM